MRRRRWGFCALLAMAAVLIAPGGPRAGADGNEAPGAPLAFRSLTLGWSHSCAVVGAGSVKCWGENASGQLGIGATTERGSHAADMGDNLPTVDLGTGRTATALAAGDFHTCALLDNGTVKCWGENVIGQLGIGDMTDRGTAPGQMGDALPAVDLGTGRTATAITAASGHTCALLDNGTVKCWGSNEGKLGLGDLEARGDQPGEMGDALPAVDLGAGRTATAITAASGHTCALLDNGTVKCWGLNNDGELGIPGGPGNPGSMRGDEPGEMGDNLPAVDLGTGRTATAIAAGDSDTCALLDNATVKCWGAALGYGDTNHRGDDPGEMGDNLPAVDLGTGRTATAVSTSGTHTCALLDDATVKCWGMGFNGVLGYGDTENRGNEGGEMGDSLPAVDLGTGRTVTAVSTGVVHTCAWLDDGSLKCWGYGGNGQIGSGDGATRGDGPGEMGDALAPVLLTGGPAPTCDGRAVTVNLYRGDTPTAAADVILGTWAAETISAGGGGDRVCAGGGGDTVNGGAGADRLLGQAGADTVNAGDGNDTVLGADGNDTLGGQAGADQLDGGAGADRLNGGAQSDRCAGGPGTDQQTGCETRTGIP